jgi:hypothetical protein
LVERLDDVDPGLAYLLDNLADTAPAVIADDLGYCLAQNRLMTGILGDLSADEGLDRNMIWRWFTSSAWRTLFASVSPEEDVATGLAYVADLRATLARRGHDRFATELVTALRNDSEEFATLWEQHHVATLHCHRKIVLHQRVGRLVLDCVVGLSPLTTQRLLILQPAPETGTVERLGLLV